MIRIGTRELAVDSAPSTLRAALVLAGVTGKPFRWERFRWSDGDDATVRVFAELFGAQWQREPFELEPQSKPGADHRIELSDSRSMLPTLRDVLVALAVARPASRVVATGSTHGAGGDTFEVTRSTWCALLRRAGLDVKLTLDCAGFAPRGGGELTAVLEAGSARGVTLDERLPLDAIHVLSSGASLPGHVQQRQAARARSGLAMSGLEPTVQLLTLRARGAGSVVSITGFFGDLPLTVAAVSERGKSAESVGELAASSFRRLLAHRATVPTLLIDSVLLLLAFAEGGSSVTTRRASRSLRGRAALVTAFTDRDVDLTEEDGVVRVRVS